MKWLMKAGLGGYLNWVWVAAAILVVGAAVMLVSIADKRHENTIEVAEKAGAATVTAKSQQDLLDQMMGAKDAADEIRNDVGFARYCGCLRGAAKGFADSCIRELSVSTDAEAAAAACAVDRR